MGQNDRAPHRRAASSLVALVLGATLGIVAQVAFAFPVTRGWEYGGQNCGCYNNACGDFTCCWNCCGSWALVDLRVTQGDLSECQAFCNQAGFPCKPS